MENYNKRDEITIEMIARMYEVSKQIYYGSISKKKGIEVILSEFEIKKSTVSFHVNDFLSIVNGLEYKRAISEKATRYFLENIKNDFPEEVVDKSLIAVQKHIDYRNNICGQVLKGQQKILKEFKNTN